MGHCIRVVFPDDGDRAESYVRELAQQYGGGTWWSGNGIWWDAANQCIIDHIFIVEVSVPEFSDDVRDRIVAFCDKVRRDFGEDSVFFSVRAENAFLIGRDGCESIGDPPHSDEADKCDGRCVRCDNYHVRYD